MRNPFRKRGRVPGAEADWDEREHVDVGDGFVAIPEEQLPREVVERFEEIAEVPIQRVDGEAHVLVDVLAAEAEADARGAELSRELSRRTLDGEEVADEEIEARMAEITFEAFNNPEHWVRDESEMVGDDIPRYSLLRLNMTTGYIGEHPTEP